MLREVIPSEVRNITEKATLIKLEALNTIKSKTVLFTDIYNLVQSNLLYSLLFH